MFTKQQFKQLGSMRSFLPLFLLFAFAFGMRAERCYDKSLDFYPLLGTKTTYHSVGGEIKRPESSCEPLQVWALIRHGTRYLIDIDFSVDTIKILNKMREEIVTNHKNGQGKLCRKDLKRLSTWEFRIENEADGLTPLGRHEIFSLGERFNYAFPELLQLKPREMKPHDFIFQASNISRTLESLSLFKKGLLGSDVKFKGKVPLTNDFLLRPHGLCPAWPPKDHQEEINKERDIFTSGILFQNFRREVSERFGFQEVLSFEQIRAIYEMCRHEAAWYPSETSTWCMAFSKEDLRILEYREDLNYYYCCGPGQDVASKIGCFTLGDMFNHFERVKNGEKDEPRGVFYFDHTLTLQALVAILEVGKYPVLKGSSYEAAANRTFRISVIGAFGSNFFSVFYKCGSNYKVQFHAAENVVSMSGCDDEGLCDWDELKKKYTKPIIDCSMDFCFDNKTMLI